MTEIPAALRERPQWVLWRDENGVKVPYSTTGKKASSTNPASWAPYGTVVAACAKGAYTGIGYVFSADDPYAGIDLDDCRTDDVNEPWAQAIIDETGSYAEVSPSGHGVKIWVKGSLPTSVKTRHIELYDRARYFTVTGQRLPDAPCEIKPAQPVLDRLYEQLRPKQDDVYRQPIANPTDDYLKEWAQKTIAQEVARVAVAPAGEKHNTRFAAARLLGGLIPLGLATADELESILYAAQQPKTEAARNERKVIRDGLASGALSPLTPPDPPRQPLFDKDGWACCPTHNTRLEPAKNGNGWRCTEYDCFWWKGEGYVAPGPVEPGKLGLVINKREPRIEFPDDWLHRGIHAADLQGREFATVNWPVQNILSEGCTLLAGKPKSKKSWLALSIAVDVALGRVTLGGLETKQSRVLYLDLESNQRRMQSRLRALLGSGRWPDNLHIYTEWPRGPAGIFQLDAFHEHYRDTGLVICDILQNIRPTRVKNANPYDEDYEAVKPLNEWGERHHAGVLALHHTRKAKADDVFDEISGSTGLSAGVAGMWVLGRLPNSTESVLAVRGRDIMIDDDLALAWDDYACRFTWTGSAEERSISQERRSILDAMTDSGEYTPKELATALGKSVSTVNKLLTYLFNDRMIEKTGHGKYVKVMSRQTYGLSIPSVPSVPSVRIIPNVPNAENSESIRNDIDRFGMARNGARSELLPHSDASNPSQNGNSERSERSSMYDHDRQREREAMAAVERGDWKAARRAAMQIRGHKAQDRVVKSIEEAEGA